jgi:hypothetical protein
MGEHPALHLNPQPRMLYVTDLMAIGAVVTAATVVLRPIAQGIAHRLSGGGGPAPDDGRIRELEAELRLSRQHLLETREQVERMAEKVGFLENLLSQPAGVGELPPGRR